MLKDHGQKSNLHMIITTLSKKARSKRQTGLERKKRLSKDRYSQEEAIGSGVENL
jgi:hypothetical protein